MKMQLYAKFGGKRIKIEYKKYESSKKYNAGGGRVVLGGFEYWIGWVRTAGMMHPGPYGYLEGVYNEKCDI